jgi:hypothetical protein
MGDKASRRGAVNLGMPLMIVAFLAMIGFMYWLNLQSQKQEAEKQAAIAEQAAADSVANDDMGAMTIPASDIQMSAAGFEGQLIRLQNVPVATGLGTQGFWIEMPNKNPFLVSMTEEVKAEGAAPQSGQVVTVIGTVLPMNDSVLTAWTNAGTIGEGDRLAAEFATHYIDARRVTVTGDAAAGNGGGEG